MVDSFFKDYEKIVVYLYFWCLLIEVFKGCFWLWMEICFDVVVGFILNGFVFLFVFYWG